jgi:hypothetical protein
MRPWSFVALSTQPVYPAGQPTLQLFDVNGKPFISAFGLAVPVVNASLGHSRTHPNLRHVFM